MRRQRLPAAPVRGPQQGRIDSPGWLAPFGVAAQRSGADFQGDATGAAAQRPCGVCRTVADSVSKTGARSLSESTGAPRFGQDGRPGHHDPIRAPHLRAMAYPARIDNANCKNAFRSTARIMRMGQMELRRQTPLRLDFTFIPAEKASSATSRL